MNQDTAVQLFRVVNRQAQAILRGRAVVRDVNAQLKHREDAPFEQDWIYREHSGVAPYEPRKKEWFGRTVTTRILHQEGARLSDIKGGDLLYEIEDEKYVMIQYKHVKNGRVAADYPQLDELITSCPAQCETAFRGALWCGAWVGVIDAAGVSVLQACNARAIFAGHGSVQASRFSRAIQQDTFSELFAKCYAGARLAFPPVTALIANSLAASRMLFYLSEAP